MNVGDPERPTNFSNPMYESFSDLGGEKTVSTPNGAKDSPGSKMKIIPDSPLTPSTPLGEKNLPAFASTTTSDRDTQLLVEPDTDA